MATTVRVGPVTQTETARGDRQSFASRARRFVRFGLVGMSGVLVNEAALAVLVNAFHMNYLVGAVLATQCSTVWNFALVEWWAFEGAATSTGRGRRFVMFWAVNMAALGLRGPILALLTSVFHIHYLISNLISLGVLVVLRFAIADSLIWGNTGSPTDPIAPDDLFAHVPRNVAEDLGWVLNPVAEAAEVGRRYDGEHLTDSPGPEIELGPEARGEAGPSHPPSVDPPRYGSIIPPTTLGNPPETGPHTAAPTSLRLVRSVDGTRGLMRRRH